MQTARALLCIVSLSLAACGGMGQSSQRVAEQAITSIGCKSLQSDTWNSLQGLAEDGSFPTSDELRAALIAVGAKHQLDGAAFLRYVDAFSDHYALTVEEIRDSFNPQDPLAWKKFLAEMEIGIRTTDVHAKAVDRIAQSQAKLDAADAALNKSCEQQNNGNVLHPTVDLWNQLKSTPEVYGARKTLAVAYQSCEAAQIEPMTSKTPAVQGIVDLGDRGDGGHTRKIGNLAALINSDYYIKDLKPGKGTCFDVRKDPPIYNYGGKPYTTSKNPALLDLFTRVSTGGPTLGIDCSGYVFSALAVAGLKLHPDPKKILKADLVWGIGSNAFKEPQSNGLACLQKIGFTKTESILPGDIAAINGHVVMIESVGADPLAIGGITSVDKCTSANINPSKFDFVIAQSSPIKNGIGISRIRAADYMPESATIRNGLIRYAVAACRVKFGLPSLLVSTDFSIVRHSKTPECMAPAPLELANAQCVAECSGS